MFYEVDARTSQRALQTARETLGAWWRGLTMRQKCRAMADLKARMPAYLVAWAGPYPKD